MDESVDLTALNVNPETGLTRAEVDTRRKAHGTNEVAGKKGHPVRKFLRKFWGVSAWMLELIMGLSAVLGKYSDLVVVGALLLINAVLSYMQERRAAGVVAALRRRLQVNARVRRESSWQVIPARELVPGDIVRVRPGDIVPADVKLLTGALAVDQSAPLSPHGGCAHGHSRDLRRTPGSHAIALVADARDIRLCHGRVLSRERRAEGRDDQMARCERRGRATARCKPADCQTCL